MIFDSLAIMEYANDAGHGSLLPDDPIQRARARSFLAWQHSGLSNLCPRLSFESAFYQRRRPLTDAERADCARLFSAIEDPLSDSGGPYLFGDLSLADLALTPTVIRIAAQSPAMQDWPLTAQWMNSIMTRPSVQEWMDDARKLPEIVLDDYYQADEAESPG